MAHYHFTLIQRLPEHRIMLSYMETIESLMWALGQLGHEVSFGTNQVMPSARNVISNLGLLTLDEVMALPKGSIFLNLEQRLIKPGPDYRNPENQGDDADQRIRWQRLLYTIDHHSFWDYSRANLLLIQSLKPKMPHFHVPIGWAPTLEKVEHSTEKDFDVIFFGSMSANRQAFFDACVKGITAQKGKAPHIGIGLMNVFGSVRDELLGRSKLASHAPKQQQVAEIFGIVRCAHLMANRIPFIAQTHFDMHPELIGSDVLSTVKFCPNETAFETVSALLDEPLTYKHYCDSLYDCIRQRDLVATLKTVL
jgi:hypothetical protein